MQTESEKPAIRKVLLLGSGGLSIGQAGEFDYSGTQAVRSLLEEGVEVIIVNPNIATVQTNPLPGTRVYLYPVTPAWVEEIIRLEKPQGIIGGFGGQTALNCLIALEDAGILERYRVKNLGTAIATLRMTEDRDLFSEKMKELGIPVPPSVACSDLEESLQAAESIGYPVIVRAAYACGGLGSGFAYHPKELEALVLPALSGSPQVLVEKSLRGWKEVEYEVMRDKSGNGITICNMENLDPLGIHTGDSIVVCPSQSLTDAEYQKLRKVALKMVHALGIVGECNAQFALCPDTSDYYVIEVNARLSRSSALASKASGYPVAHIAAKVVLGNNLMDLKNPVTGITSAFYEPALDYITIKVPRWDLTKFHGASRSLDSTMKSVGEIMAIGRSFPEALQKAFRMITENSEGICKALYAKETEESLKSMLKDATDTRLYAVMEGLRRNYSLNELYSLTAIDKWFLFQLRRIVLGEREIRDTVPGSWGEGLEEKLLLGFDSVPKDSFRRWKQSGFSDEQMARIVCQAIAPEKKPDQTSLLRWSGLVRKIRKAKGVVPLVKKIDTTAAEYPSPSNYLYLSYEGSHHDELPVDQRVGVMILGGGAYRIGTSVEFDWCAVTCSERVRQAGLRSILINCNPETVSTDYNASDRLYFEELSLERILDISEFENTLKTVVSMGGQLPNQLAGSLATCGLDLLGHSAETIGNAEDRALFSALLDRLGIDQPVWTAVTSKGELKKFIDKTGFPVLIRPSFVLSGAAMKVAYDEESLERYMGFAREISRDYPVVVSQFLTGAREIELDGVARNGEIITSIVSEHIENAGIHSGDATTVVPAQKLYVETVRQVKKAGRLIAEGLNLNGPFNIQFLALDNHIRVIECNARAARSFPFISKTVGLNLAAVATDVMVGQKPGLSRYNEDELPYVGVKAAMFSFTRLRGADPVTGVEMASTGEVGCISPDASEALLLALEASSLPVPRKGVLVSAGPEEEKIRFLPCAKILRDMGLPIYTTEGTGKFLAMHGIDSEVLPWPDEEQTLVLDLIRKSKVDLVINCPKNDQSDELTRGSQVRQAATRFGCPLLTNMEKTIAFIKAASARRGRMTPVPVISLPEFRNR